MSTNTMFKIPRLNVIESEDGYSVEVIGRVGLLYREGEKVLQIDSEVLNAGEIAIIEKSIKNWNKPYDTDVIDNNYRAIIIKNIQRAFEFKKTKIEIW